MTQPIEFEGQIHEFPDDFTDKDIATALKSMPHKNTGIATRAIDPESGLGQFAKGTYQGVANTGIGLADLIPGVNIPRTNFSGDSTASKLGETAGEIGSFAVPGFGIERAAKAIPYIGKAIKAFKPNALTRLAKGTGEGALFGAVENPEDQLGGAGIGAGLGAGAGILSSLSRLSNPLIRSLTGAGAGALTGAGIGSLTPYGAGHGAETGALLGAAGPSALSRFGINRLQPGLESLEHLKPEDVMERFKSGQAIGRTLSPAEASGNPFISSLEAQYGKRGAAARKKTEIGQRKYDEEESSINKLLDTIHDNTKESNNRINDLYTKSEKFELNPFDVIKLKQDPVINQGFKIVKNDPAYQKAIGDSPENSIKYLDKIARVIGDLAEESPKDKAKFLNESRKELIAKMEEVAPDYKMARQEAQKKIIRYQIEDKLGSKKIRATDFYNTILKNNNQYKKLLGSLKNVPEAQEQLRNMKKAFEHVINLGTTRGEFTNAEKNMKNGRSSIHDLIDRVHEFIGTNRNQQALDYLYSPEWIKGFDEIAKLKDKTEKNKRIYDMIGNILTKSVTPSGREKT